MVQQYKAQKEEIRQMVQDESAAEPTENQMNQNKPSPDDWLKMAAEEEQKANELEKAAKKAAEQYEDAKDGDEKKNSPLVWIGGAALAGLAIIGVLLWKRKSN
jgi:LPXTG-motif cell wall-anchored protein